MFRINSGEYTPIKVDGSSIVNELPVGVYTASFHPMKGYFLTASESFTLPQKIYGASNNRSARILKTFEDRSATSTGVLLIGEKGSGKTLLAKSLSVDGMKKGYPTILISSDLRGPDFNDFIAQLPPCIVLFDEFEKVYGKEEQQELLSLLDGVVNTHKLYVLTANDKFQIDSHFSNRPGRIFYYLEYGGIDEKTITEFCEDKLKNKNYIPEIVSIAKYMGVFTFDMLSCLVEETNRQSCKPSECLDMLNIKEDRWGSHDRRMISKVILPDHNDFVLPDEIIHSVYVDGKSGSHAHILSADDITITIGVLTPVIKKSMGKVPVGVSKWITDNRYTEVEFNIEKDMVSYDPQHDKYTLLNKTMNIILELTYKNAKPRGFTTICSAF